MKKGQRVYTEDGELIGTVIEVGCFDDERQGWDWYKIRHCDESAEYWYHIDDLSTKKA